MKKKILIVLNAVAYNRGSEALVRGLSLICKNTYNNSEIYLSSSELNFGEWINIPNVNFYVKKYSYNSNKSLKRIFAAVLKKIFRLKELSNKIVYKDFINKAKGMDLIIIIGADNYDKSYGMFNGLHHMNELLRKETNAKMLMYDCSLEKKHIDNEVVEDFDIFDAITARESITFNNFKEALPSKSIYYYPDPAFVMETQKIQLPSNWEKDNMVGINVSSLITEDKYGSGYNMVMDSYYTLMEYIINKTEMNIVLVPHVMKNADLSVLSILYEKYKDTGRVILIDNEELNAAQLKYIISNCKLYVGARTHSTIAAYSTCVPTLVLGYSIKSIGIARDIFGDEKNYVISVSKVKDRYELTNAFKWIQEHEINIKEHLVSFMPKYIEKVEDTSEVIKKLLEESN